MTVTIGCGLLLSLSSIDPDGGLGRFGRESMTDQQRMEFMCEGVTNAKVFQDQSGFFHDVCEWKGVTCNAQYAVTAVNWKIHPLLRGGTLDLSFLPASVTSFGIKRQNMHGSIPAGELPTDLHELSLTDNFFSGTIEWALLPGGIVTLLLDENYFIGSVDLTRLPESLQTLGLSSNQFSGAIDVCSLPRGLLRIYLNDNKLSQEEVLVDNIPERAECYIFTENKIASVRYASGEANPHLFF